MSSEVEDVPVDLSAVDKVDEGTHVVELSVPELRDEQRALADAIEWYEHPWECQTRLVARKADGWRVLRQQLDVEYPECPEDGCENQEWAQQPGDPYHCTKCDHEVADPELSEQIRHTEDVIMGEPSVVLDGVLVRPTSDVDHPGYTVSTDRLDDEGVLVLDPVEDDADSEDEVSPEELQRRLRQGELYLPEATPAYEPSNALDRLTGGRNE